MIRILVGLLLLGVTLRAQAPSAAAGGFTPLFDGKTLNNWVVDGSEYARNFSVRDGMLHIEGTGGWLRSSRQYGDFTLRLAFRYLTDNQGGGRSGVSGVFLRTPAASTYQSGWPDNSLEVSLANAQGGRPALPGDGRWGGAVVRHGNLGGLTFFDTRTALLSYGKTGDWQTLEIQAIGDAIHVTLNGNFLGSASAGGNARGYIGLQAESGAIEFRSVEINEGVKGLIPRTAEGFVPLFDGKTLAGWKRENPDSQGFDIVDGALAVRGRSASAPNRPACNLSIWTEKEYGDFTLRYQARFETNASVGGFLFRTPASGGPVAPNASTTKQGGWNQIETRAMGDNALPWNGIIERAAAAEQGDTAFDYRAATLAYAATGDWTRDWVDFEVQARGGRVVVWVNGFLVSKAEDVLPLKGIFGLQCERETVEYRNILIREIPPAK